MTVPAMSNSTTMKEPEDPGLFLMGMAGQGSAHEDFSDNCSDRGYSEHGDKVAGTRCFNKGGSSMDDDYSGGDYSLDDDYKGVWRTIVLICLCPSKETTLANCVFQWIS
jgi:hypothetical protein